MTLALAFAALGGLVGSTGLGLAGVWSGYATRLIATVSSAVWLPSSFLVVQDHLAAIHAWLRP